MPSVAPEAEKQSSSPFRWVVNDNVFTTKTDISTRNLRLTGSLIDGDSDLKNLGKFLTAKTPQEVEDSKNSVKSIDPVQYEVRSNEVQRTGIQGRKGTKVQNFYGFDGKANNVAFDRNIERGNTHLTETDFGRMCCPIKPLSTATTVSSIKLQDWNNILETSAPQRGGLNTRNYVKDTLKSRS
tara:strand:+ start:1177 stop:1725 length:549 start_codon:yes stop_codon:yes gene_type:complete